MPLRQDERALYSLAQKRIMTGALPYLTPKRVWAGSGAGEPCSLCGKDIELKEVEYEIEEANGRTLRFHLRCHAIWQLALPDQELCRASGNEEIG
jgi:hypothetical protein